MKKIFITLLAAAALTACIEDKTSFPTDSVDDITVTDIADGSVVRNGYLEPFDFAPTLMQGDRTLDDENYSYRWELNEYPQSPDFEVIGTERELHTVLNNPISNRDYVLKLTVTDLANELEFLFSWQLYIQPAFLDGLVVSDTKDGTTSDLTLIMNDRLTINYAGKPEKIFRDILATATGSAYPGLLDRLFPTCQGYYDNCTHYLWAIDENDNPVRFECTDYSQSAEKDILLYRYEGQRVSRIFSFSTSPATSNSWFMMTTHGNYRLSPMNDITFGMPNPAVNSSMKNDICAWTPYNGGDMYCAAAWVDDKTGRFVLMDDSYSSTQLTMLENPAEGTPAFDAEDAGDRTIIGAGMTYDENIPALLFRENATGEYAIYTITPYAEEKGHYEDPDNWEGWVVDIPEQPYAPRARIVLPAAVGAQIDRAVDTEFCTKQAILYVATPEQLSAVLFATGTAADGGVKFTPDAGERITSVKLYRQGQYLYGGACAVQEDTGTSARPLLDLTNSAVIVTTQKSETEGFVYVVPMTQLGTGNLDRSKAMKFDGFGKILDVNTTGY